MKRLLTIIMAILVGYVGCYGQIARNSKPGIFQFSASGGFPSRETQVKGPLHQYTLSAGTQYNEDNLYGLYGLGGYYPSLGFSVGIFHYDRASFPNGTPYSNHYSASVHYEQAFWSSGRWSSYYMIEGGFGYTSDCYDPVRNPESTYGGHFHVAVHLGAFLSYNISDNLRLSVGPSYAHHSNSRTNCVNTGCDAVSAELALAYFCEPVKKHTGEASVESMGVRKHYWDIQYGACITGAGDGVTEFWTYVSHKASVSHLWRTFRRAAIGIGADAFFDKGGNENRNAFGISGAVDYYLTRNLLLSGHVGFYVNGAANNSSPIYETVGLNYSLNGSKWYIPYVGFATKANAGKAEHLELSIGFRFG